MSFIFVKMNEFQIEVLRQVVGHCSHNIGWNGIHASSLDLLTEVLQKYLTEVGQSMHRYSEQCKILRCNHKKALVNTYFFFSWAYRT